ncbi:MAG: hypothetical protein ACR2LN_05840 [Candidatus Levyibacteriota bacterium]
MERPTTFVDTMMTSVGKVFSLGAKVACGPAAESWDRTADVREQMRRRAFRMLRLRASKIRPYTRQMHLPKRELQINA